jgi:hypothetical protein
VTTIAAIATAATALTKVIDSVRDRVIMTSSFDLRRPHTAHVCLTVSLGSRSQ